jgi:hypothetical protein
MTRIVKKPWIDGSSSIPSLCRCSGDQFSSFWDRFTEEDSTDPCIPWPHLSCQGLQAKPPGQRPARVPEVEALLLKPSRAADNLQVMASVWKSQYRPLHGTFLLSSPT